MPSRVQAAPLRPAQPSNRAIWGQFTYGRGAPRGLPGGSGGGGCPIGRVPHQGATHARCSIARPAWCLQTQLPACCHPPASQLARPVQLPRLSSLSLWDCPLTILPSCVCRLTGLRWGLQGRAMPCTTALLSPCAPTFMRPVVLLRAGRWIWGKPRSGSCPAGRTWAG